jgi:hypothetical protein
MHLYLVVDCKTPDCDMFHILKYLGVKGEQSDPIPLSIPCPLILDCPKCRNPYTFGSKDIRQVELEKAPPSDFRESI